jgi:membrane protein
MAQRAIHRRPRAGTLAAVATRWRDVTGQLWTATRDHLRGKDLALHAAGVTFYAAIAMVPMLLVAGWMATLLAGTDQVIAFARSLEQALPATLGAGRVASAVVGQATEIGPLGAMLALLPATLYGEGLRRTYASLSGLPDTVGRRGRLAVLPVLVVAPLLLLAVLGITPLLADLFQSGPGPTAVGIYLALTVDWLALSVPLSWSFRVVAADPPPWRAAIIGGFVTGAFVSGFLQGFVLFLSLPLDLGAPFGGLTEVGAVTAVLLWLWWLHVVVLVGYVTTRQAVALRLTPIRRH